MNKPPALNPSVVPDDLMRLIQSFLVVFQGELEEDGSSYADRMKLAIIAIDKIRKEANPSLKLPKRDI